MTARRTLATVLGAAALAAASALTAAPAQADGPTHSVVTEDFVRPNHLLDVCGFPVELHVSGSFNLLEWTDGEGNVTKEIRNFRFRSTSTANGVSINGISMGPEIWTFAEDGTSQGQIMGVVNRRVPGQGTVTLYAGYELKYVDGDVEVIVDGPAGQREDLGSALLGLHLLTADDGTAAAGGRGGARHSPERPEHRAHSSLQ